MHSLHNLILRELENLVGFIISKYNLNNIYSADDTVLMANLKKIERTFRTRSCGKLEEKTINYKKTEYMVVTKCSF